jgi:putative ABC transport system permease protein
MISAWWNSVSMLSPLTLVFSVGAIVGGMITVYAAAQRIKEIGTLRALGFQPSMILLAFLLESLIMSLIGGLAALFSSSFLQLITVSTTNFQRFSELAFRFSPSLDITIKALAFSLVMGFAGGILPAFGASRMEAVEAFREV